MAENLLPLQESFDRDQLELEMKEILLKLYDDNLKEIADEINTYGMPHNGSVSLIERLVTADGLIVLRQGDESGMRYLWNAWKHLNPERGFHFLKTYLQVIFGDNFEINQQWQKKSEPYPTSLKSISEIGYTGEDVNDYFLTSRVFVDIDTDIFPDVLLKSLKTALAARFLLKVRIAKFSSSEVVLGGVTTAFQVARFDCFCDV